MKPVHFGPLNYTFPSFSSVQFSGSVVYDSVTLWIAARQASLSITNSQSSLRLKSMESVMPSSHLILCHPLLLLPPIPPSIRVFSSESTLHIISDTFTIRHLVTWKLGVFRYLCEDFVMWLTMALGKCQKRSDVIIIAGVVLRTLGGNKGSWLEFWRVDFFLVVFLLNNVVRNQDCKRT